jgi:hypothetical protein
MKENFKGHEILNKYGRVRTCKIVHDDVATVVITDGFKENAITTLECLKDCTEIFPDHTHLETMVTEENFYLLVLVKIP